MDTLSKYRKSDIFLTPQKEKFIDDNNLNNSRIKNKTSWYWKSIELLFKLILILIIIFILISCFKFIKLWLFKYTTFNIEFYNGSVDNVEHIKPTVPKRDFKAPKFNKNMSTDTNLKIKNIRDFSNLLIEKINNIEKHEKNDIDSLFEFNDNIEKLNLENEEIIRKIQKIQKDIYISKFNYQNYKNKIKNHKIDFISKNEELEKCLKKLNSKKSILKDKLVIFDKQKIELEKSNNQIDITLKKINHQESSISLQDKDMREELRLIIEKLSNYENTINNINSINFSIKAKNDKIIFEKNLLEKLKQKLEDENKLKSQQEIDKVSIKNQLNENILNLNKIKDKEKYYINKLNIAISNKNIHDLLEGIGKFQAKKLKKLINLINDKLKNQEEKVDILDETIDKDILNLDKNNKEKTNFKQLMQNFLKLKKTVKSYDVKNSTDIINKIEYGVDQVKYIKIQTENIIRTLENKLKLINNNIGSFDSNITQIKKNIDLKTDTIKNCEDFIKTKNNLIHISKENLNSLKTEKHKKESLYKESIKKLREKFHKLDSEWKSNNKNNLEIKNKFNSINEIVNDLNLDINKNLNKCTNYKDFINEFEINFKNFKAIIKQDADNIENMEKKIKELINKIK